MTSTKLTQAIAKAAPAFAPSVAAPESQFFVDSLRQKAEATVAMSNQQVAT